MDYEKELKRLEAAKQDLLNKGKPKEPKKKRWGLKPVSDKRNPKMKNTEENQNCGCATKFARSVVSSTRYQSIIAKAGVGGLTTNQLGNLYALAMIASQSCERNTPKPTSPTRAVATRSFTRTRAWLAV